MNGLYWICFVNFFFPCWWQMSHLDVHHHQTSRHQWRKTPLKYVEIEGLRSERDGREELRSSMRKWGGDVEGSPSFFLSFFLPFLFLFHAMTFFFRLFFRESSLSSLRRWLLNVGRKWIVRVFFFFKKKTGGGDLDGSQNPAPII